MADIPSLGKDRPSPAWIDDVRRRFPVEREIDRVLTRKLLQRAGPGYVPQGLDALCQGVEALLRAELDTPFQIRQPKWLAGGASKLQMAFDLVWTRPGVGPTTTRMVLRMEPAESAVETSRLREFQLIKAFEGIVPVPPAFWVDMDGTYFPYPAIVYGFADGVTKPSEAVSNVSGTGINFGPALRPVLGPQYVEHLARIHTADWRNADLSAFDVPALGTQAVEWQINWWERVWAEDANEAVPLLDFAASWLRRNMPPVDRLSVVHGDFRAGNFLYREDDQRISAWLDWELGHLGDRHEDLAYSLNLIHGHKTEDDRTFLVMGLMPTDEFFDSYEKASGLSVDPKVIRYYQILNCYKLAVVTLGTTYRTARGGKTHQDVLLAWLIGAGYVITEDLRRNLEEVA
ncbi:phosphotransferase family protein [Aromatoleum toluclasticum]|uniref:phosphotransferase family protein n=1 Tax=Aromatoleum toluclasticum TaxID=92003 RepID=UPI00037E5436|nr:phosphotransferase family protein [Aromatoleum toluclasticum]